MLVRLLPDDTVQTTGHHWPKYPIVGRYLRDCWSYSQYPLGELTRPLLLLPSHADINSLRQLHLVDRFGRVKLLGFGAAGLCLDLIYSAVMARQFANSDNKVGKGFAILGIYIFTATYCEYA